MFRQRRTQISAAVLTIVFWITMGTLVFHHMERWTWIEALYFSVVTLTTVGYGDLHPTTDATRLVTVIYILVAVAAALSAISIIGTQRMQKRAGQLAKHKDSKGQQ